MELGFRDLQRPIIAADIVDGEQRSHTSSKIRVDST